MYPKSVTGEQASKIIEANHDDLLEKHGECYVLIIPDGSCKPFHSNREARIAAYEIYGLEQDFHIAHICENKEASLIIESLIV